jgi:dTDP-4-dehydrorhamnose reductase
LSVYGQSKLEGERAITASGCRSFIFRTSWVYAPRGRNFLHAILAAGKTKPELRVVDDQRGAPTSSPAIAGAVVDILSKIDIAKTRGGLYHLSAGGTTTWHGFASAILHACGLNTPIVAIASDEYPVAAKRPKNSMLDNSKIGQDFGLALPDWRFGLAAVLAAMQ